MIASEFAPVAQAGGLGEVVLGLSREAAIRGHHVEAILPKYDTMRYDRIDDLSVAVEDLWVPWYSGHVRTTVWQGWINQRPCFFIEPHSPERFFARNGLYGFDDDALRFSFFSKAALEFLLQTGRRPDVIHCHDWQAGLVPVLLYELYQSAGMHEQRVCYTIHNFAHQGLVDQSVLWAAGLQRPEHFFHPDRLQDPGNPGLLNLMKGGIVYSNAVTTVSPQHAWEALHTDQGHGLGPVLHTHRGKFQGILNGIDYDVWNPQTDPFISEHYSIDDLEPKYANKKLMRDRFWLRQDYQPVIGYVGRLDHQKGVHLIRHALLQSLRMGAQFVLLGTSPRADIQSDFHRLKHELNDHPDCHLELGFSPELAHLIYAGADVVIVPSMYEPCGLAQLIALRYGTVPVVRHIGGLVDTVHDRDYSDRTEEQRSGFVFHQADEAALDSALHRAIHLWHHHPEQFRTLMRQGMAADHSWARPGLAYVHLYDHIRHR
jgi:starch synthase